MPNGVKEYSITNISFNPHGEHQPLPIWYNHFNPKNFDYGQNNQIIEKIVNNSGNIKSLEPTRYNIIYQFEAKPFQNQTFNRLIQIDLCLQPSKTSAQIKTLDDRNINSLETLIKAMEQSQYVFLSWGVNDTLWNMIAHQSHFEIQNFYEYLANRANQNQVFMYTIDEPYSHQPVHSGYRNQKKHLKQITLDDLNAMFGKNIIQL